MAYCSKTDTFDAEEGVWVESGELGDKQGNRTDLQRLCAAIDDGMTQPLMLIDEFGPELYARYTKFIEEYIALRSAEDFKYDLGVLRPWQAEIIDLIKLDPHPRHIIWVHGPVGGEGKSSFCKYLVANYGAFYCAGGKTADIVYGYKGQRIVLMDLARDSHDYVNYGALEQLKNGLLFNTKYNSGMRQFETPHVLVMSNFMWDEAKMSHDRVIVKNI